MVWPLRWQLVTFLVCVLHDSLQPPFFHVSDSPALFITPQDQQLLTDSLSNASMLGIASAHDYALCKYNTRGVNTREREGATCVRVYSISRTIPHINILGFKTLLRARLK